MASNDEDTFGSDLRHKRIEAASRLGGLLPESSFIKMNEFRPRDCNAALLSVEFESTSAKLQTHLKRREEHPHGSGSKDSIYSSFHVGSGWQDSIRNLLQTKSLANCQLDIPDAGGSCAVVTSLKETDVSSTRVYLKNGDSIDNAVKEKRHRVTPESLQSVTGRSPLTPDHYQESLFQEMGFPPALVQRAILLHGAQADDSIILHFLLDSRGNYDVLGADYRKQPDHRACKLPIFKEFMSTEDVSGLSMIRQHMKKNGAEQLWDSKDSDSTDCDFGDNEEASPPKPGSPTPLTVERGSNYPISLCKRKLATGGGYRHLMRNYGFAAELVKRAIQDLGEGVDYDMLLEYLLYRTAQHEPKASTSPSYVKRAITAKKLRNGRGYPIKQQISSKKRTSTVEILVDEFGYEAKNVERAVVICGTPLWNAEEDQLADLVDFLATNSAGWIESEDNSQFDEDSEEHCSWSWRRQRVEEDAITSGRGQRNLGYGVVSRRRSIVRLSGPSTFKEEQYDHAPLSLAPILKRENSSQPSLSRNHSSGCMAKVKLVPSLRRYNAVGRIDRSRMIKGEVSITVNRHDGSVGFGLPGNPVQSRYLDEDVKGAPFFYFENVASMPNDEWDRIRRHLFDIEPEFVDSLHFSACRRPRGYIHNLPIEGRRKILADPPMTIQELLPHTNAFWPAWDPRTKLNCITTRMGSEFLIKKLHIREGTALQTADPSIEQQREILHLCRHWNLVWTAPNIPTPINEIEIEAMLGFDAGHSRNILSNRSRYKALGNSFSVYTVAFHFSVLKPLYPKGVKVLSLFSGIGGAEVALHKMGVKLLVVVSVEIDDGTRRCLEAWWASSKQAGVLNQNYRNIKDLGRAQISELVNIYGGFDLIVGGTPCNNLSGSNHVTRVGLDGKQSSIFFEFSRVVAAVRELTIRMQQK